MSDVPPPPPGFTLDSAVPPPPAGFTIDKPPAKTPRPPRYGERVEAAGKKLDRQLGTGVTGVAKAGVAASEVALEAFTGVAGDIAGAATSVLTQDPKKGKAVSEAISTHPATSYGQTASEYVNAIAGPLSKILDVPRKKLEESGHPIFAQLYQAGIDLVGFEEIKGVPKGIKKITGAATKEAPKTPHEKLEELAGEPGGLGDAVNQARKDEQQALGDMVKFRPVRDPKTGKFTVQGPAYLEAEKRAEAAGAAVKALEDKATYKKIFSKEPGDIKAVQESIQKMGKYAPAFADEAISRMGASVTSDEFNAANFVRKYDKMPAETKWSVFGAKGEQYVRDLNSLTNTVRQISDLSKRGKLHMPPGLHHLDFTRTDIIIASLVAAAGAKVGIPHLLGFGVGLYAGKPIERLFNNPKTLHILRNTADAALESAYETGRIGLGTGVAASLTDGREQQQPENEPFEKRHGTIQR